jgi:hypothetical protein
MDNKIENINLDLAVKIIRDDIGYKKGQCIRENMAMAAFLREMDVFCTFEFGESIYFPFNNCSIICHREDYRGMRKKNDPPFHCWLEVDEKVLDIAVGSWTNKMADRYKKEYIFWKYHKGFNLKKHFGRFNYYPNRNYIFDVPHDSHSYLKFDSKMHTKKAFPNRDDFRSNMTMYEDLKDHNYFKGTGKKYAQKYKKLTH